MIFCVDGEFAGDMGEFWRRETGNKRMHVQWERENAIDVCRRSFSWAGGGDGGGAQLYVGCGQ